MKTYVVATVIASSCLGTMEAYSAETDGAVKDAWIDGKLEAVYALNPHLSAFAIDTTVAQGVVQLTGEVQSDIDRDLAGEIAKGIDGVVEVDNDLLLAARADTDDAAIPATAAGRSFGVWIDDATTTARVKTKLVNNPNTAGLQIDVDTRGDVVTLSGEVGSAEESVLAEELARNTGDVKDVRNQLIIRKAL
jgi:hyperosmotically inducible periplasmic protein